MIPETVEYNVGKRSNSIILIKKTERLFKHVFMDILH